jgi:hypothetical protein
MMKQISIDTELDAAVGIWASEKESNMSYQRRKDVRSDESFAVDMSAVYVNEKYSSERFLEKLELYSPYPIVDHEILVTSEVYKGSDYRDEGDLLVILDVNGEERKIIFDIKAVPPKNNQGKSLRSHKSVRINMDSHNGMIKKGHVALLMIGTTYDTERVNILITDNLKDIEERLSLTKSPKIGHHQSDDKYYYDLSDSDEALDLPWFSMTDPNPSDDDIENFREMIRRAVD